MSSGQRAAALELVVAGALWGFGFIGAKWALTILTASEILFLRFALASCIGLPLAFFNRRSLKRKAVISFLPAIFLFGTLFTQTVGLIYTTPTKSAFITTLYVVFVPILEALLKRRAIPIKLWACVILSILGMAFIVDVGAGPINIGDMLTLLSALIATAQIYFMGTVSPRLTRPFLFNMYQCFWCTLFCLPLISLRDLGTKLAHVPDWPNTVIFGVLTLGFGATVIAFFLQVRAQATLSRTVSSLLFLLESPFALLFSLLLLGQSLKFGEAVGAVLIFASAFAATQLESP